MIEKWLDKLRKQAKVPPDPPPQASPQSAPPANAVAPILDLWLEQAASLKQLRMHDHAVRVLNAARGITLESMQANPTDPMVWVNIGRVQLASEDPDGAKKVLDHAKDLAHQCGDTTVEGFANAALFQVLRQQHSTSDKEWHLKDGDALSRSEYRAFLQHQLEHMFYVCQSCGHFNLIVGGHCPHCHFAPQNLSDVKVAIALSTLHCRVPQMLPIALAIQRGRKLHECIDNFEEVLNRVGDSDQGILEKIRSNAEDDHLDFKALDHCSACGAMVWSSWAEACPSCHAKLNKPALMRLAICVDRILQQFVWTIRSSDSKDFERLITLLVNMKYLLLRAQIGPTDAQRDSASELLVKLSPLYTQNGGGVVWVKSNKKVAGEVINPNVHKDIEPTIDYLRGELTHFLRLMNDAISLF